ncbi:hypothetical protein NQ318_003166 [Aromia moschata]|uniref:Uncharacterized protein n=1 Tax=Aromia moschata TaxID=1265417 RepID=A0AAV8XIV8_9CUCU|nr:hypothetical protein NQ318_003166 [Aromia moschata]
MKNYIDSLWTGETHNVTSFSEYVLIAYSQELADDLEISCKRKFSPCGKNEIINIMDTLFYYKNRKSEGYMGKKFKTFSPENIFIRTFIDEAADD